MINREIFYERNLTGNYMKIPVSPNPGFDEKIMLKRKLPGLLPVEQCYVNGNGQYWYNISGKQSLDMYCRTKDVGIDFIERMIISICNEIEILEWNLLDVNCLILDPELIFVTNQNKELIFTLYPGEHGNVSKDFQQLMEYMLTKVDHKDLLAVKAAYGIYEKSLDEAYTIMDIKDFILEKRGEDAVPAPEKKTQIYPQEKALDFEASREHEKRTNNVDKFITLCKTENKVLFVKPFLDNLLKFLGANIDKTPKNSKKIIKKSKNNRVSKCGNNTTDSSWIEPEPEVEMPTIIANPTTCLTDISNHPKGRLIYTGGEGLSDIMLTGEVTRIGQGPDMEARINKSTISHFHAKIEVSDKEFYIEDINSTNGTRVNDDALSYKESRRLKVNDIVQLADVTYRFV